MRRQIAPALCAAVLTLVGSSSLAIAQQRAATACVEEYQANTAANQARGVTEKGYVARRRGAPARPTAKPARDPAPASNDSSRNQQVYLSIKDLMESIIDPSADTLWGAVGTVIDNEGVHETLPKTQEEWFDVHRAAVRMIEGANLLMMPDREAAPAGTKSEAPGVELEPAQITALLKRKRKSFDAFAKELQLLGLEALQASDARNVALLMEIGARIENVCESCHKTFWYPQDAHSSTRN